MHLYQLKNQNGLEAVIIKSYLLKQIFKENTMLTVEDVDLTPNPHALKFILNEKLLNFERRHFGNKTEAANDSLASGVFQIPGVASVFYTDKFITIEKSKESKLANTNSSLIS
jgi:hypothetical protein